MKEWTQAALIVGILLVGGFYLAGVFDKDVSTPTGTDPSTGIVCQSSTTVATTFSLVDKYQTGSAQAAYHYVRLAGTSGWTQVANSGSANFAPYDEIEVLFDHNGTIGYGVYKKVTLPCATTHKVESASADFITANITGTFWNAVGTASTAQPLTIGQTVNVKFQFTGTFRRDYGNSEIGYNLMNCKANSSEIQDFVISGLDTAVKPQLIAATSGYDDYTFEFPVIQSNADTAVYTATVVASDSVEPTEDIVCTVYDSNYYIHSITGAVGSGVQNDLRANVGVEEPALMARVTLDLS